jgi:putative Holliday junction resolvase
MRNMGLDIGDKRIGIALSDPEDILASPLTTIIRNDDSSAIGKIKELIDTNEVNCLVIGLPYSLSGEKSSQTNTTLSFIDKIKSEIDIKIILEDERFSTSVAQRLLSQQGKKKRKNKGDIDAAAAAYILQGYLDKKRIQSQ